jgi:DNA-binding IclR family transcriptional regulator
VRTTEAADRVVTVLELLAGSPQGLGPSEIGETLGVHKATASRLLGTLAARHLVERMPSGRYRLGPGMIRLAGFAIHGSGLVTSARPTIEALSVRTGETVTLGILEGLHVLYVDEVYDRHSIVSANWIGRRSPAHCSSSGKVLVAFDSDRVDQVLHGPLEGPTRRSITDPEVLRTVLADVRRRGFAASSGELEEGLNTVAVPVRVRGVVVAAVSISGPSFRLPAKELPRLVPVATAAAESIARDMREGDGTVAAR